MVFGYFKLSGLGLILVILKCLPTTSKVLTLILSITKQAKANIAFGIKILSER
jgi:hypothetical protein